MNTEALFLFLILLLGLLLCSFLGGNCNKEGLVNNNSTYNGPNGATANVATNSDGTQTITLIQTSGSENVIFTQSPSNSNLFTNPLGFTATLSNGNLIFAAPNNGPTQTFTPASSSSSSPSSSSSSPSSSQPASQSSFISSLIPSLIPSLYSSSSSSTNNYDNYNHYSGSGSPSQLQTGMTFTDPSGNTINVIANSNGSQSLQLTSVGQSTPMVLSSTPPSTSSAQPQPNTFYAPFGGITATMIMDNNNQTAIQVNIANNTIIFTQSGSSSNSNQTTSTQYYGSTGSPIQTSTSNLAYQGPYGGSAGYAQGPYGNTSYYAQGPNGNAVAGTTNNSSSSGYGNQYYSSLPQGIPASQIPPGNEDLYILKSQVVPPVCPVCSVTQSSYHKEKESCPPCKPCGRCPEPAFECKKVPNYNAIDEQYLPQPVLSDFSQFGM